MKHEDKPMSATNVAAPMSLAFTEDVAGRFLAYGWNDLRVGDAN
jgi:transketolase